MPILPPNAMAPPPPANILHLSPRQVAESDYATKMRYAAAQREAALQAEEAAEQRVRDQQFHEALLQNARTEGAGKAVNTALRFQGMRGFERDRSAGKAAGLSDEQATLQALQKNAGRMFIEDPGHIAPSMRMLRPPTHVPAQMGVPAHIMADRPYFPPAGSVETPFDAREVRLPSGQMIVQTGPKSHQFPPRTDPPFRDKLSSLHLQADILKDELSATIDPKQREAIRADLAELRKQVKQLEVPTTSAPPQGSGSFPPAEAPNAPAVPSPAAGASLSPTPAAAAPARAAGGFVLVRDKRNNKEYRYPKSMVSDFIDKYPEYELVK